MIFLFKFKSYHHTLYISMHVAILISVFISIICGFLSSVLYIVLFLPRILVIFCHFSSLQEEAHSAHFLSVLLSCFSEPQKRKAGEPDGVKEGESAPPQKKSKDLEDIMTRTGGAYIPPAKLRMLQAQITDKSRSA